MNETDKIKERYASRKANAATPKSGDHFFETYSRKEREQKFAKILLNHFRDGFKQLKLLEIGAGTGMNIHFFLKQGFVAENIWANELLEDRFTVLRKNFPDIHTELGNAADLAYDEFFDIVFLSTVFTSILDDKLKKEVSKSAFRMVKPGGMILWYDFVFDNPLNTHVKPIGKREVMKLFPEATSIRFHRLTLAHPIGRRVFGMYNLINFVFPFLRTHIIAEIYK